MIFNFRGSVTIARLLRKGPSVTGKGTSNLFSQFTQRGIRTQASEVGEHTLSSAALEFKKLIEGNADIRKDCQEMFTHVHRNLDSGQPSITHYLHLLAALDKAITAAPTYNHTSPHVSSIPMYNILAPFCNSQAGCRVLTHPEVNQILHGLFDRWASHVTLPASRDVLVSTEGGWFSPDALQAQEMRLGMSFGQAWECDPDQPHMGFKSWNDFFTRRFREGVRPVSEPDNPNVITAPCEAIIDRVATGVQATDEFLTKGRTHTFKEILNSDPLGSQLVGGTVCQSTVSALDYHRWHSPVDGRVVKTCIVPGTHYAAHPDGNPDGSCPQTHATPISTRALIFIESDNPRIGLICFVGVGLGHVSTVSVKVKEGDRVKKGDETGSFHFGGSTSFIAFPPGTFMRVPGTQSGLGQVNSSLFNV